MKDYFIGLITAKDERGIVAEARLMFCNSS